LATIVSPHLAAESEVEALEQRAAAFFEVHFSHRHLGVVGGLMRIFPWWILGVWPNKRVLLFWCALASYRAALYKNTYDIRSVFSLQDS